MVLLFEKLHAYELALNIAGDIAAILNRLPRGNAALSDQLVRASMSISANLAEGVGRGQPKDRRQFYLIARGSAHECVPFLEFAQAKQAITKAELSRLKQRLHVISKMITALIHREGKGVRLTA